MTSSTLRLDPCASPDVTPDGAVVRLVRAAARVAQRRPKTVVGLWLLVVILCVGAGSLAGTRSLTDVQSEVGESAKADALIQRAGLADPAVENILVTSPASATTAEAASQLSRLLLALPAVATVRSPGRTGALSADRGRIALVQATLRGDPDQAADHVGPVQDAVATVARSKPDVRLQESGDGSQNQAINDLIDHDLHRAEQISLPITLVILVLAFGALVAACVPLLLGLTSVAAALGALGVVSHLAPNSDSTSSVVVLIGLAFGVDYSLFYVRREREERRRGRPEGRVRDAVRPESALDAAAASVGRAILVSGLTVVVALAGLLITGARDFISMGIGTILVVLLAVAGSLTVLPATLALLGDRVERGRVPGYRRLRTRRIRRQATGEGLGGFWAGLARTVTARPGASLVTSLCLLGALAVPLLGMRTADLSAGALPANLPIVAAAQAIGTAFPGAPQDTQLVVSGTDLGAGPARTALAALGRAAMAATGGTGEVTVAVSGAGRVARIDVPMPDQGTARSKATLTRLRTRIAPAAAGIPGARGAALVTGDAASSLDFSSAMSAALPEVIGFVLTLGFVLLLIAFRAPLLAAAVMLLNLASIGAAYGILTVVFQHTWAEGLLSFHSTGYIVDWLPLFMFVILFGLSMDYTVLVLERIREARLAGLAPRQAAAQGVAATAGTVTSAAVVMVAVFAVFATFSVISFKQLGVGLSAAVLLDATLVRGVALPATVALLGERGWPIGRRGGRVDQRGGGWVDRRGGGPVDAGANTITAPGGCENRGVPVPDVAEQS